MLTNSDTFLGFLNWRLNVCFQEVENLRKQAEIIPQLMAECESITTKLQVFKAPRNPTNPSYSQVWFTAEYKGSLQHTWDEVAAILRQHTDWRRAEFLFNTLPEGWWHNIPVTCLTKVHRLLYLVTNVRPQYNAELIITSLEGILFLSIAVQNEATAPYSADGSVLLTTKTAEVVWESWQGFFCVGVSYSAVARNPGTIWIHALHLPSFL